MTIENEGSARLEELLERLADEARITLPEWRLLQDITNGTMLFDPVTIRNFHANVEDAEEFYFEKWEVSRNEVLEIINRLDVLDRLAVVYRIDQMWAKA